MAYLRKRGSIWYVYWRDAGRGSPVRCQRVGPKKADALRVKATIEHRRISARFGIILPEPILFKDFSEKWLATRTTAPKTAARDQQILRAHLLPAFGSSPIYAIAPDQIGVLVATIAQRTNPHTGKRQAGSARRVYAVLHKMLADAVKWGYALENAAAAIAPPPLPHYELRFPTIDELGSIVAAIPRSYRAMVFVALLTGLRWGELVGLQWADVDLEAGTLSVRRALPSKTKEFRAPKWGSRRVIDLLPPVRRVLMDLPQRGEYIFPGARGGALSYRYFHGRLWRPAMKKLSPSMRIHDLRHAYASLLLAFGDPVLYVARQLGHSSVTLTVDTYGHLLEAGKKLDRDATLGKLLEAYDGATRVLPTRGIPSVENPSNPAPDAGAAEGIRTPDPRITSAALYP